MGQACGGFRLDPSTPGSIVVTTQVFRAQAVTIRLKKVDQRCQYQLSIESGIENGSLE